MHRKGLEPPPPNYEPGVLPIHYTGQMTYPWLTGPTRVEPMLLPFVRESGTIPETTEPKERGTPPKQRDPRNTLYIRNIIIRVFEK